MIWIKQKFGVNQYKREDNWSLYFWMGLSWKWVLCDPSGWKVAFNDEIDIHNITEAQQWANEVIDNDKSFYT